MPLELGHSVPVPSSRTAPRAEASAPQRDHSRICAQIAARREAKLLSRMNPIHRKFSPRLPSASIQERAVPAHRGFISQKCHELGGAVTGVSGSPVPASGHPAILCHPGGRSCPCLTPVREPRLVWLLPIQLLPPSRQELKPCWFPTAQSRWRAGKTRPR